MRELNEAMKEKIRFEVCHDAPNGTACSTCVLAKMGVLGRIVKNPFASASLKEICLLEGLYVLSLVPANLDTPKMKLMLMDVLEAKEVVH